MTAQVVVPFDGHHADRRALAVASTLAAQLGARLEMVMVHATADPSGVALAHQLAADLGCRLDEVRTIETGATAGALATLGSDPDVLLCMASHGRSPVGELVLGSVSADVMRTAQAPLVLVGPHVAPVAPAPFETLLVGLDSADPRRSRVLGEALRWAARGLHPWLVRVLPVDGLAGSPDLHGDMIESAEVERAAAALRQAGVESDWEVLHDHDPALGLAHFGGDLPNPLALLATHGRTGVNHLLAGSVTLGLVHHAPWPVLVVPARYRVEPLPATGKAAGVAEGPAEQTAAGG